MTYTGCWIWDVRREGPAYWSAEMFRIHGRDPAGGLPSFDEYRALHRPGDWSGLRSSFQRCIEERADIKCTCEVVLPKGLIRKVQIVGHPVLGSADRVTEIIGSTAEVNGLDLQGQLASLLTKPANPKVSVTALQAALARDHEQRQRADMASLRQRFALLTPREREVLPLVVSGMLNKQAAALLNISEVTLQVHRGQIMKKMEAASFADLVRMAGKLGIPEPD